MERRIAGYHQDKLWHWVADLECGHTQHVRHEPPLAARQWVLTAEGRAAHLGTTLDCPKCDRRAELKARAQATIDGADPRDIPAWQKQVTDALAASYLAEDDPRWQSGFDGDEDLWRSARALILDAVDAPGTFLDVGCANGYLIESLERWSRERGQQLEFFGLELSPDLAAAARKRLPHLAGRIFEGSISTWMPPHRFDYVHVGVEFVPQLRGGELIERVIADVVKPGGRLILRPMAGDEALEAMQYLELFELTDIRASWATDRNGKGRAIVFGKT